MSSGQSKSWTPAVGIPEDRVPPGWLGLSKPKLGLGVILAVVTMIFLLLLIAYTSRMQVNDWHPLPEPRILWLNTGILVFGSISMQWAKNAWLHGDFGAVRYALLLAGLMTILFLTGQSIAWLQIRSSGYLVSGNPATSFFYLITLIHGLHLAGGLVAWLKTFIRFIRGISLLRIGLSIELCAVYWHFLLVVWLLFYGLMLST